MIRRSNAFAALLALTFLALNACGGGGAAAVDTTAPSVLITSPAHNANIPSSSVLVTGQATDAGTIVSLTVNGIAATTSNGYATWSVTIPLTLGGNVITAMATDAAGNSGGQIHQVTRVNDTFVPTAEIMYPPADAVTTGATVTVIGTADDDFTIQSLNVNGVAATTTDGYAHWRATVPLVAGANVLSVMVSDGTNTQGGADTVNVKRTTVWAQRSTDVSYDPTGDRMLVVDSSLDSVLGISATDTFSVLSSASLGTGAVSGFPNSVASIGTSAFVGSNLDSTIAKIDLTNGNRTALTGGAAGSGTAFVALFGIGVDASRNRLLALDFHNQGFPQENRLFTVDPSTGARTLLSGGGAGSGATMGIVSAIIHDAANDRYLTAGTSSGVGQVLAIDPVTGARTELSGITVGSGASLLGARDIVLVSSTVALVMTVSNTQNSRNLDNTFVAVDLATGVRTDVTHTGVVSQPTFASGLLSMDLDPDTGDVYLTDSAGGTLWRLDFNSATDIASITLVEPTEAVTGSGPKLVFSSGLAYDPAGDQLFVTERRPVQLTGIDVETGVRTVTSSFIVGTGTVFGSPRRVEWDAANARAVVVDGPTVYGVAPATGNRTLIASDPALLASSTLVASTMDASRNRIVLGGQGDSVIHAMDLTTGVVTTITTLSTTNAASAQVRGLAYDPVTDRYFAADEDGKLFRIFAVSGVTQLMADGVAAGLDQPGGMVVVSSTVAYVYDQLDGDLFRLNLSSSALTRVFGPSSTGTKGGGNDGSLAWDAARSVLYWTDNGIHGISVFEPVSGDRVIISR